MATHRSATRSRMLNPNRIPLAIAMLVAIAAAGFAYSHQSARAYADAADYVAIGSSFAAGPGNGHRASNSPGLCEQSDINYPHLLARELRLSLHDVTCSGASTQNVLKSGQWFQPAQVMAVGPRTKLVTVTIGGNDVFYLGYLTASACINAPTHTPWLVRLLGRCRVPDDAKIESALHSLPDQLRKIIIEIRRRAPGAQIVFIDYTTVLPDSGTCSRLPLSALQADRGRYLALRLAATTSQVARENNARLLQVSGLTHGHDVCSSDPWVYGFEFPSSFLAFGPVPFHPTEKAMRLIAARAAQQLAPVFVQSAPKDNEN